MCRWWWHHGRSKSRWRQWRLNGLIEIKILEIKILLACAKLHRLRFSICPTPLQIRRGLGCELLRFMPQMPFDVRNLSTTCARLVLMLLVPDPGRCIHQPAVTIIVDWGTHDRSPIDLAPDASLALSRTRRGFVLIDHAAEQACLLRCTITSCAFGSPGLLTRQLSRANSAQKYLNTFLAFCLFERW